jgi:hypothetical protein
VRKRSTAARTRRVVKAAPKARSGALRKGLLKPVVRHVPPPPVQVLYRFCKSGWAVIVEKTPHAQGTRFLCPFCTVSHRVSGPVRGFRKMRRAPWIKLRRVEE